MEKSNKEKIEWIDIAKGIGIILVVAGHFQPESSPEYWMAFNRIIYTFHMPLFFVLSGYLYNHNSYSYIELIKNKIQRLLYPFFTIAAIFLLIKILAGRFFHLDFPVNINSIAMLVLDPIKSYIPLLWFILALFMIFLLYPLARRLMNNVFLLIFLIIIISIFGSDFPLLGTAIATMPFFVVGAILKENQRAASLLIGTRWYYIIASFIFFALAYAFLDTSARITGRLADVAMGVAGSVLVINASQMILVLSNKRIKQSLLMVGFCSMTIYLFHTVFESAVRIGFSQLFKSIQVPFEIVAILAITSGVFFPLILEMKFFRNHWLTRKFLLGLN